MPVEVDTGGSRQRPQTSLRFKAMTERRKEPNTGAEALLMNLFRQALSKNQDAINAMHTIMGLLPRRDGGITFILEDPT